MYDAFNELDIDLDRKIYVDYDSSVLLAYVDGNYDRRVDRAEFLSRFEQSLYHLVLEDVLTNPDTLELMDSTKKSPIDYLFPLENSTIGEKEIGDILKKFDRDGNGMVSRKEMAQLFMENKEWVGGSFATRIEQVKRKLNF